MKDYEKSNFFEARFIYTEPKNDKKGKTTMKRMKKIVAYLDGKVLVEDVLQAALDNHMMLDELKRVLVAENPGHDVVFKFK